MKKIFYIMTLVAVLFTACNKDPETTLEIGNASLEADAAGGTYTFNVKSNSSWTITTDNQDWYTVTPASGQDDAVVTVTVDPYTDAAGRSAQITVTADDKIVNVTLVQARPAVPADPETKKKKYNRTEGTVTFEAPEGYTYKVAGDCDWAKVTSQEGNTITVSYGTNTTGESRTVTFKVLTTDDQVLETFTIEQSANLVEKGQLVIEEVFFTGTEIPDGDGTTSGDQYIKITNNCDETVYADSLMIGLSALSSNIASTGSYWKYPETPDSVALGSIYMVPGKGRDVAIEPGKSIVLAISAQDYSKDNAGAVNLSKADFEFYDENDIYPDTDNADVANLTGWVKESMTITQFHSRGYESYAIMSFPYGVNLDTILNEYIWKGTRTFIMNGEPLGKPRDFSSLGYILLPNAWVLDGVNCAVEQYLGDLAFNAGIDAGWTGCGKIDFDPDRLGKSVRRISAGGKLADTDNSTNDFQKDAKPSLK